MSKKMIKIYSKIQKKKLLHQIFDKNNLSKKRTNLCNDKEFLQAAFLNLKKRDKFRPHSHIWKKPRFKRTIAQESWFVLRGKILFYAYDIDGKLLSKHVIKSGGFSFTFGGGHTYETLSNHTQLLEHKTGPYEGIKRDKIFI